MTNSRTNETREQSDTIRVAIFDSAKDNHPDQRSFEWEAFRDAFEEPDVHGDLSFDEYITADRDTRAKQKDGLAWSPTIYKDSTQRAKANVEALTAFVGDLDDGKLGIDDILGALQEYGCIVHSSYSHSPAHPKYRAIIRYRRPVTPAEHARLFVYFNELLGGSLDEATKDASRIFYLPACPPGGERHFEHKIKMPAIADPDAILARLDEQEQERICHQVLAQTFMPMAPPMICPAPDPLDPASNGKTDTGARLALRARIQEALARIPSDDYHEWIRVGIALKRELGDEGIELYHAWSSRSEKYDHDGTDRTWRSFKCDSSVRGVSAGTIFHLAKKYSESGGGASTNSATTPVDPEIFEELVKLGVQIGHHPDGFPEYPVNALGKVMAPAARVLNSTVQAPMGLCGQSLLAAASLAVQGHANVRTPDGRETSTSLFLLTIAESGERKSQVDKFALQQIRCREIELEREARKRKVIAAMEFKRYEAAKEAVVDDDELSVEEVEDRLDALGPPPQMPRGHQILIQDSTFEGLVKLYQFGQCAFRSMLPVIPAECCH